MQREDRSKCKEKIGWAGPNQGDGGEIALAKNQIGRMTDGGRLIIQIVQSREHRLLRPLQFACAKLLLLRATDCIGYARY